LLHRGSVENVLQRGSEEGCTEHVRVHQVP